MIEQQPARVGPMTLIMFLAVLVFYAVTGSFYPYPDESSVWIMKHLGIDPMKPVAAPLWGLILEGLDRLPGPVTFVAAGFNMLLGALSACYFFRILFHGRIHPRAEEVAPNARLLLALAGVLFLVVAPPFWQCHTRGTFAAPGFFLLLLSIRLMQHCFENPTGGKMFLFGACLGLGAIESPDVLIASPFLAFTLFLRVVRSQENRLPLLLCGGAGGLVGILFFLWPATVYLQTPVAGWLEGTGFPGVLKMIWLSSAKTTLQHTPIIGWLLIAMAAVLPFVLTQWEWPQDPTRARRVFARLNMLVVLGLTTSLLFASKIAPWSGQWSSYKFLILVLLTATTFARGVAFWHVQFSCAGRSRHDIEDELALPSGRIPTAVFALFVALVGGTAIFLNAPDIGNAANRVRYELAEARMRLPIAPEVLITQYPEAPYLALAAHDINRSLQVVSIPRMGETLQRDRLKALHGSERLDNLLAISRMGTVKQWLAADTNRVGYLAIDRTGAMWLQAKKIPVPGPGYTFGMSSSNELDMASYSDAVFGYWKTVSEKIPAGTIRKTRRPQVRRLGAVRVNQSRYANNLGMRLKELGHPDLAQRAFEASRTLWTNNPTAHLNLYLLSKEKGHPDEASWQTALNRLENHPRGQVRALLLRGGRTEPETLSLLAETLFPAVETNAVSPSELSPEAIRGLERIAELLKEEQWPAAAEQSRAFIQAYPGWQRRGHRFLALAALETGDQETIESSLKEMESAEAFWPEVVLIFGEFMLRSNQWAKARAVFERLAVLMPRSPKVLENLVLIAVQDRQSASNMRVYLDRLLALQPDNHRALFGLGMLHTRAGDYPKAEAAFAQALEVKVSTLTLNNIAHVAMEQERYEVAMTYVKECLSLDSNDLAAWLTGATIHIRQGRADPAQTYLERAAALDANHPLVRLVQMESALASGRRDAARSLQDALLRDPSHPDTPREVDRIWKRYASGASGNR